MASPAARWHHPPMQRYDAVVLGAGTAGASTAWQLAARGLRVAFTDTRPLGAAGARWINGVPPWMFDEAGVPRPEPPERRGGDHAFTLLGVSGRRYLSVEPSPVWAVDMRALVARLQALAVDAGATGFGGARVVDVASHGERPTRVTVDRDGQRTTLEAPLFVDATGTRGVLRERVPALAGACPKLDRRDLCSAAQAVFRIADEQAARDFLHLHSARPGDVLCRLGVSGGYSVGNLCVDAEAGEVEMLTGAIARPEYLSGPAIVRSLLAAHPWIGRTRFGGAGVVPLRRPYDRFVAEGVALVGNAACQVFPAHGSGVGIGMVAARMLADSVADASDPGSMDALWRYQAGFQRRWGGLLAAYDVFRRLSQSLEGHEVELLLETGLINVNGYREGLDQKLPAPDLGDLRDLMHGARQAPGLVAKVGPALARMAPALAVYRMYPERFRPRRLLWWSRAIAAVMGDGSAPRSS